MAASKWHISRNGECCGGVSGLGCKSCTLGIKKLSVHDTESPAAFSTQEGISFTQWHFPYSTDTHWEATKPRSCPQAATLGSASPVPCEYSSSETQLIPGTWVLWKETMKSLWFVSSPLVVLDYEDLPKRNSSVQTGSKRLLWEVDRKPLCLVQHEGENGRKVGSSGEESLAPLLLPQSDWQMLRAGKTSGERM